MLTFTQKFYKQTLRWLVTFFLHSIDAIPIIYAIYVISLHLETLLAVLLYSNRCKQFHHSQVFLRFSQYQETED